MLPVYLEKVHGPVDAIMSFQHLVQHPSAIDLLVQRHLCELAVLCRADDRIPLTRKHEVIPELTKEQFRICIMVYCGSASSQGNPEGREIDPPCPRQRGRC